MRSSHRHELRSLAYLTLDHANGGIIRNLTSHGVGAQLVTPVHPGQHVRARLELRAPRLRIESHAEVVWASAEGQCGIRLLDLPPRMARQVNEWILGNLLDRVSLLGEDAASALGLSSEFTLAADSCGETDIPSTQDDGLMVSPTPRKVIELHHPDPPVEREPLPDSGFRPDASTTTTLMPRPFSARGLARTVDGLVVLAGTLLVAVVFLFMAGELPRWPFAVITADVLAVALLYWGFFRLFGGASLGTRLARLATANQEGTAHARRSRFR